MSIHPLLQSLNVVNIISVLLNLLPVFVKHAADVAELLIAEGLMVC